MKTQRKLLLAAGLAAVLTLGGCWDSNDDAVADPPVTAVPDSAGVSTAAFFSFVLGMSATDETSEPLTIGTTFAVPADETADPTPLT